MNNAPDPDLPDELLMIRLLYREQRPGAACPAELIDVATGTRRAFPSLQALVDFVMGQQLGGESTTGR